jgi:superfamily II DNA or RNA helicase
MNDPIISLLRFPFELKVDQVEAVNAWLDNNCRGTILYSTGTGKTEISFECARRLVETYKKNHGPDNSQAKIISSLGDTADSGMLSNGSFVTYCDTRNIMDTKDQHIQSNRSSFATASAISSPDNYRISFFNILFLVPRVSLISQTIDRLIKYNIPSEKIGGYFGERKEIREIVVSTFHSVIRNPNLIKRSNMVIIDEVHLIRDTSSSFKRIFDYLVEDPNKAILGLTATFNKKDSRNNSILAVLPPLRHYPIKEAVVDKRLAKPVIIPIDVKLTDTELKEYDEYSTKIKNISNKFKRYDATSMTLLLRKGGFASGMAKAWFSNVRKRKLLLSYNENKLLTALDIIKNRFPNEKIMVFSETLESIERFRDLLKQHNIESRIIDAKVKSKDRANILERWGVDFNVLLSIHTLELGIDVPQVRIEIILATTSNINQIVQRIGRVLRLVEGKTMALIYVIYVDDTTDNRVLGVINHAINANRDIKSDKTFSNKHHKRDSVTPLTGKAQIITIKNSDEAINNPTKILESRTQRAISIVESSLDNSLIVEEKNKKNEGSLTVNKKTDGFNQEIRLKNNSPKNFTVRSNTDRSKFYNVNLEDNTCTCADFIFRQSICKHIIATKFVSVY